MRAFHARIGHSLFHVMIPLPTTRLIRLLLISGVIALTFGLALSSLTQKSPTFDEQGFIIRGLAYLRDPADGGTKRIRVGHPPGLNVYNALLLARDETVRLPLADPSWQGTSFHRPAELFLWEIGNDVEHIMFLARVPTVWLGLLLIALVGRWAAEMAGGGLWTRPGRSHTATREAAGLLALLLTAFDPNLLAHMRLATTDFGLTVTAALAGYGLWRLARRPSALTALLAGVGLGLMLNTKFTALLFLPLFALVILLAVVVHWRAAPVAAQRHRRYWLLPLLIIYPVVGLVTLWAGNGFDFGRLPAETPFLPQIAGWPVPLSHYLEQLLDIGGRLQVETPAFLLGHYRTTGWWYYFPVAFVLKTPLPTLILLVAAGIATASAVWSRRGRLGGASWLDLAALLVPALGFFAVALSTEINLGYRHILPILPFLFVFAGAGLGREVAALWAPARATLSFRQRAAAWLTLALTGALVAVSLWIFPHYLAYFNRVAGGPQGGWRALVDSNLDWGQDLQALGPWMAERGVERVWLSYFGEARPDYYGIAYDGLDSFPPRLMNPLARPFVPSDPAPGWYAISATNLQGVHFLDHDQFRTFRDRPPEDKLGYSIFLYDVPARGEPVNMLLSGLQVDEIHPDDFALMGTNDVTLRWFDGNQAFIVPQNGRPTWLAASSKSIDSKWPNQLAAARPLASSVEAYSFWQLSELSTPAKVDTTFILNESQVDFLGATVEKSDGTLAVETVWQQQGAPEPLKIFIHVLDRDGNLVTQWDGLDAAWDGWRPGDVLYQRSTLELPAGAVAGDYRIVAGLYDPTSLARWQTESSAESVVLTQGTSP